ncbi:hypothetical protein HK097_006284, partial [Rhizophlyctis rosea]
MLDSYAATTTTTAAAAKYAMNSMAFGNTTVDVPSYVPQLTPFDYEGFSMEGVLAPFLNGASATGFIMGGGNGSDGLAGRGMGLALGRQGSVGDKVSRLQTHHQQRHSHQQQQHQQNVNGESSIAVESSMSGLSNDTVGGSFLSDVKGKVRSCSFGEGSLAVGGGGESSSKVRKLNDGRGRNGQNGMLDEGDGVGVGVMSGDLRMGHSHSHHHQNHHDSQGGMRSDNLGHTYLGTADMEEDHSKITSGYGHISKHHHAQSHTLTHTPTGRRSSRGRSTSSSVTPKVHPQRRPTPEDLKIDACRSLSGLGDKLPSPTHQQPDTSSTQHPQISRH